MTETIQTASAIHVSEIGTFDTVGVRDDNGNCWSGVVEQVVYGEGDRYGPDLRKSTVVTVKVNLTLRGEVTGEQRETRLGNVVWALCDDAVARPVLR